MGEPSKKKTKVKESEVTAWSWATATTDTATAGLLAHLGLRVGNDFLRQQNAETLGGLHAIMSKPYSDEFASFRSQLEKFGPGLIDFNDMATRLASLCAPKGTLYSLNGELLSLGFQNAKHGLVREMFKSQLERITETRKSAKGGRANEPPKPIIVSGSSGAGKTTFVGQILPDHLREAAKRAKEKIFFVYTKRGGAIPEATEDATTEDAGKTGLMDPIAMGKKLCLLIKLLLKNKQNMDVKELPSQQIELVLIIDEMGLEDDKKYIGNDQKLTALQDEVATHFDQRVQLVIAGTGMDVVAANVNTDLQAVKVFVEPWTVESVRELALTLGLAEEHHSYFDEPVLADLGTNARAAMFMIQELINCVNLLTVRSAVTDNVVVRVAEQYVQTNGLANCDEGERRYVAKLVLEALQAAEEGSTNIPSIGTGCTNTKVKAVATGLLDFHVEYSGQAKKLREGKKFSITVSPAVAIVLSALMGAIETCSWEGFKRIGALDALGALYISADAGPAELLSIVRASCPFPATSATNFYKAPVVDPNTVLLNGIAAPHADCISYFRFGQFKKSKASLATVDLQEELGKMGLMKQEWYEALKVAKAAAKKELTKHNSAKAGPGGAVLPDESSDKTAARVTTASKAGSNEEVDEPYLASRWMTRCLLQQWGGTYSDMEALTKSSNDQPNQAPEPPNRPGYTRHMYPFSRLFQKRMVFSTEFYKADAKVATALARTDLASVLPAGQSITVVFATNAFGFKLTGAGVICRLHVGNDGVPNIDAAETVKKAVGDMLEKNVQIKFLMCEAP